MIKKKTTRIKRNIHSDHYEIRISTDDLPPLSDDLYTYNHEAVVAIKVRITQALNDTAKEIRKEKKAMYKKAVK